MNGTVRLVQVVVQVGEVAVDGSLGVVQSRQIAENGSHMTVDAVGVVEGSAAGRSQVSLPEGVILGKDGRGAPGEGGQRDQQEVEGGRHGGGGDDDCEVCKARNNLEETHSGRHLTLYSQKLFGCAFWFCSCRFHLLSSQVDSVSQCHYFTDEASVTVNFGNHRHHHHPSLSDYKGHSAESVRPTVLQ